MTLVWDKNLCSSRVFKKYLDRKYLDFFPISTSNLQPPYLKKVEKGQI